MLDYQLHTTNWLDRDSPLSNSSGLSRSLNDIIMEELFDPSSPAASASEAVKPPGDDDEPCEQRNGQKPSDKDPDLEKLIDRMLEIQSLPGYTAAPPTSSSSSTNTSAECSASTSQMMATPSWTPMDTSSHPQSILEYKPSAVKQEAIGFHGAEYYPGYMMPRPPSFATHPNAMRAYSSPEDQFVAPVAHPFLSHAHSMSTLEPSHNKLILSGPLTPLSRRSSHGSSNSSHCGTPSPSQPMSPFQSTGAVRFATENPAAPGESPDALLDADKLCAVCGDRAACQHYGARTCEGCKGFFKRTVQKKSQYVCQGNRNCLIDKQYRNRCQYCRFQKCIAVGMVKEVVRCGSLQGRRGRLPSKTKSQSSDEPPSPPVPLITSICRAYTETRPNETVLKMDWSRQLSTEQMLNLLEDAVEVVQSWAARLPGFPELPQTDREILIKNNMMRLLSVRLAYRSMDVSMSEPLMVCFENGAVMPVQSCPDVWQSWLGAVRALALHFKQNLDIDLQSYSCLCALVLLELDEQVPLVDIGSKDKLQQSIINALKDHCSLQSGKQPYFSKIFAAHNDLEAVASQGQVALNNCQSWSYALPSNLQRLLR